MALHLATKLADKGISANCDICAAKGCKPVKPAKYDLPTQYGWAYACHTHAHEYGKKV